MVFVPIIISFCPLLVPACFLLSFPFPCIFVVNIVFCIKLYFIVLLFFFPPPIEPSEPAAEEKSNEGSVNRGECRFIPSFLISIQLVDVGLTFSYLLQMLCLQELQQRKGCHLSEHGKKVKNQRQRISKDFSCILSLIQRASYYAKVYGSSGIATCIPMESSHSNETNGFCISTKSV